MSINQKTYKLGVGIEELILVFLIALNILDFLEILPGELDYIKRIISWTLLGYLMYRASLTRIFFGARNKLMDLVIVITYFFLVFKNFVAYTLATYKEVIAQGTSSFLFPLYHFLAANQGAMANVFEHYSFYIGGVLLLAISLYFAVKLDIQQPSVMQVIRESGAPPRKLPQLTVRFLSIFLVLAGFFVIVFNLVMEWLAIAVDAPIIVLGLFFYIFVFIKYSRTMRPGSLIFKIGNFGESFYHRFINLFYSKSTIWLGITGMLVLHLLTDLGNFVIPYLTSLHDPLYFAQFEASKVLVHHHHLFYHFLQDIGSHSLIPTVLVYLLNSLAILALLIGPAFIWYILKRQKEFGVSRTVLGIFYLAVTCFLLVPLFRLRQITTPNLIGTDIITQPIGTTQIMVPVIIALAVGIATTLLAGIGLAKKILLYLAVAAVQVFFGIYIYHFFVSASSYYITSIVHLLKNSEFFIAGYLFVFFGISIIFYMLGFLAFLYLVWKKD